MSAVATAECAPPEASFEILLGYPGFPGRVVRTRGDNGVLEHGRLPEPGGQALEDLAQRVPELETLMRLLAG